MAHIYSGVVHRSTIKRQAQFWQWPLSDIGGSPIGMTTQFVTIGVFREWLATNRLPTGTYNEDEAFANGTLYPHCRKHNLHGRCCFLHDFGDDEVYGEIEKAAMQKIGTNVSATIGQQIDARQRLRFLQKNPFIATPLEYLLAFAHISRIVFNLRAHMLAIYEERLKTVNHNVLFQQEFRVAMHVRRGDSCRHEKSGYQQSASPLHSPPQISMNRLCYDTKVYMDALKRVQELLPGHHLVVYLATDHTQSLIDEIKAKYPTLYQSSSWKYLDYSRDIFNYMSGKYQEGLSFIESPMNENKALLGETAVLDIWHLSHGRVFLGHVGSRFGKLSWWQAASRYNSFIPFFTVDGHSTCCDIDENCGANAEYVVSMENCLAIFFVMSRFATNETTNNYWQKGATYRVRAAAEELQMRRERQRQR